MAIGPKIHPFIPGGAQGVVIVDAAGNQTLVTSVIGTVVASFMGQPTFTASIAGNIPVTQVTSPWIVQVASMPALQTTTVESVWASQVGGWVFTGSVHVNGQAAHDAAAVGNPLLAGALATTSVQAGAVVASGDVHRLRTDLAGRLLMGHATPEDMVSFVTSPTVTVGSTYTPLLDAAGTDIRYYITDLSISVTSIGTQVNVMDGGKFLFSTFVDPQGGDCYRTFQTPIRATANSSLFVQFVDSGANAVVAIGGYKGL